MVYFIFDINWFYLLNKLYIIIIEIGILLFLRVLYLIKWIIENNLEDVFFLFII